MRQMSSLFLASCGRCFDIFWIFQVTYVSRQNLALFEFFKYS